MTLKDIEETKTEAAEGRGAVGTTGFVAVAAWAAAGAATLLAAGWVGEPGVSYLAGCVLATALAAVLGRRAGRRRAWVLPFIAGALLFLAPAVWQQRALLRIDRDWDRTQAMRTRDAEAQLATAIANGATEATAAVQKALDAPTDSLAALASVQAALPPAPGERGLVLFRAGQPFAWAGMVRVPVDSLRQPVGLVVTPFYTVLFATRARGADRAVATVLVHAAPPANVFARGLDRDAVSSRGDWRFELDDPSADVDSTWHVVEFGGAPLIALRAIAPQQASVRTRTVEDARALATPAVALMILLTLAAAWTGSSARDPHLLRRRLIALLVPLVAIGIVPLTGLSNATRLFDPAVFFAPHGGQFAASIGALSLTSIVVLLGLFAILRARRGTPSRWLTVPLVVAIGATAPFLMRDLARGISPPPLGVSVRLWMAWQIGLFLPAAALLIAGATAGRAALGRRRGVAPLVAPVLGGVAALVGPQVWLAATGWPAWYGLLWCAAVIALALTRRARAIIVAASAVAGLASATLVWGVVARKRVEAAVQDVRSLTTPEVDAVSLLQRLGRSLISDPPPLGAPGALLERYASSALFDADYPVVLQSWVPSTAGDSIAATVSTANVKFDVAGVRALIENVRRVGEPAITTVLGEPGIAEVLAVPHTGGRVTTVAVFPRTRLLPESPLAPLLAVTRHGKEEPPYSISVIERHRHTDGPVPDAVWRREETGVHSDWTVATPDGSARAHVEVTLRPIDALAQRGALLVLLDMALIGLLWVVPTLADGAAMRRLRVWRAAWARSYRARLSIALFTFFVVPAAAFAIWSYRQLQTGDRQSRELLVGETLRTAAAEAPASAGDGLTTLSDRLGTPLLVYEGGALTRASDPLFFDLAPIGLFLPAKEIVDFVYGNEVTGSQVLSVGPNISLFGYRVAVGSSGQRLVIAAPARTDDVTLEQRRRDLGFLVMLVAVGGALAALWLSGLAARELDRPVGALREAALAIASGERNPQLAAEPPAEFRPVFAAFQRMASDLSESRSALEAAQRRTAVVLRNVASGVLAVRHDGLITIANPRAEQLIGTTLTAGQPFAAAAPPNLVERVSAFLAARGAPADEELDFELHGRQLRVRLTRLVATRVGDEGAAVVTVDDLTELARAQRVLAWGEMARQIAHEIKNPLTPMRLGVQHLRRAFADRRGNFEEILDRNVDRILEEIDRLDEIARAFSRYGTAPDQRAPGVQTDIAAVTRDVVALERLGQGSVAWEIDGADAPVMAVAREDELREVLLNLLENARHAGARIVRATLTNDGNDAVTLRIVDDGSGIPADVLPRVFEPHFSTRTSGSGLGLAISRRMIDSWGGSIALDSGRDGGTTVTVRLLIASETRA